METNIINITKTQRIFKIARKFLDTSLIVNVGKYVKKGDVISSGLAKEIKYRANLKDIYATKEYIRLLNVIDKEIVKKGQLLAEGNVGFKKIRLESPCSGIVSLVKEDLRILKNNVKTEEVARMSGVLESLDFEYYYVKATAVTISPTKIFIGNKVDCVSKVCLLSVEKNSILVKIPDNFQVDNAIVVVRGNLISQLYGSLVKRRVRAVICGGIEFKEYKLILKNFPMLPVDILSINAWGLSLIPMFFLSILSEKDLVADYDDVGLYIPVTPDKLKSVLVDYVDVDNVFYGLYYPFINKKIEMIEKISSMQFMGKLEDDKVLVFSYKDVYRL